MEFGAFNDNVIMIMKTEVMCESFKADVYLNRKYIYFSWQERKN